MNRTRLQSQALAWTAAVLLLASAGAAAAQKQAPSGGAGGGRQQAEASAAPSTMELDIRLTNDTALLLAEQTWVGKGAKDMRHSLDVFFGAADGNLEQREVDAIARATESDMRNKTVNWLKIDDRAPTIRNVTVSFEGAAGRAEDLTSIGVTHDLEVALPPATSAERRIELTPRWNGTLAVTAPPGYVVSTTDAPDSREATATIPFVAGTPVVMTLKLLDSLAPPTPATPVAEANATVPETNATPEPATPTPEESTEGSERSDSRIPGPAFALALGALAFVALALRRRS